ncbi:hypothetical protein J4407_00490 [Candidatus Pacearchaeota archaeon]|nr:hypothetical protein [Candidatus Pacearchaeota archaeon]
MGIIRGIGKIFLGILLLASLIAMNFFLVLYLSLDYENVQPEIVSFAKDLTEGNEQISSYLALAEQYCAINQDANFVFTQDDFVFDVPCNIVAQGEEAFIEYEAKQIVEEVYYSEYECGFVECFEKYQYPFFIISEHAKEYWKGKFYISFFVAILLAGIMFFLFENKGNFLIIIGSILIISVLPLTKIDSFVLFLGKNLFGEIQILSDIFVKFISIMLSTSNTVLMILLFVGIFLIIIGLATKFFNIGKTIIEKIRDEKSKSEKTTQFKKKKK